MKKVIFLVIVFLLFGLSFVSAQTNLVLGNNQAWYGPRRGGFVFRNDGTFIGFMAVSIDRSPTGWMIYETGTYVINSNNRLVLTYSQNYSSPVTSNVSFNNGRLIMDESDEYTVLNNVIIPNNPKINDQITILGIHPDYPDALAVENLSGLYFSYGNNRPVYAYEFTRNTYRRGRWNASAMDWEGTPETGNFTYNNKILSLGNTQTTLVADSTPNSFRIYGILGTGVYTKFQGTTPTSSYIGRWMIPAHPSYGIEIKANGAVVFIGYDFVGYINGNIITIGSGQYTASMNITVNGNQLLLSNVTGNPVNTNNLQMYANFSPLTKQ